jgi:hypothetical protein
MILSEIFNIKIAKIQEWHALMHKALNYRYEFNVKFNLDNASPSYKIIKSKKLYASVIE